MDQSPSQSSVGFRIIRPLELLNWSAVAITPDIPFDSQASCPACQSKLEIAVVLKNGRETRRIRIGTCPMCGYTGYIDRPSRDWISTYYADIWTHSTGKDSSTPGRKTLKENSASRALNFALDALQDTTSAIAEIGCGYGSMLTRVRERGFNNIVGIESSRHRARLAATRTNFPILLGDFESETVMRELEARAPIKLFYSFHVLEHTYHPAEIVEKISALQGPGDLLLFGVPNLAGEPAMNILLFLPHLHTFTLSALRALLARNGYEVIDTRYTDRINLNVIARKLSGVVPRASQPKENYLDHVREKFVCELTLNSLESRRAQRYFWSKKNAAQSGIEPYHSYWRIADRLWGRKSLRSILVAPLQKFSSSSIAIEFSDEIFLAIK